MMQTQTNREYEYLDLLEEKNKRLDQYQYEVCIEDNNVVVAAGAGSGKTQVLATRFAWLVMSKNIPCGKILTLTFTNKAAGEMYERIYQTLKFFAENPKTPDVEKKRAKQALLDFSEVHIQTLDSYCGSIVRQVANVYGIRPDFAAGASDDDVKSLALPFVFEHRNDSCIQYFSKAGKLQNFANEIVSFAVSKYTSLATEKNHFEKKLLNQINEICTQWNKFISNKNDANPDLENNEPLFFATINEIRAIYDETPESKKAAPYGIKTNSALTKYDELNDYLSNKNLNYENLKISSEEDFSRPEIKFISEKIPEILKAFNFPQNISGYTSDLREKIKVVNAKNSDGIYDKLTSVLSYVEQFSYIKDLCILLDEFTLQVNNSKRQSGNLSFSDITELALKILIENKEIRKQEKEAFDRIMIDEFQDNNGKNRDLLFLLSEKDFPDQEYGCKDGIPAVQDIKNNKLFFVGDEKQSIYKFRGADVQVFNNLKDDLGRTLQMNNNYRSSAELLSSFNNLFGNQKAIFDNLGDEAYEARYLPENFAKKYNPVEQIEIELPELSAENSKTHAFIYDQRTTSENPENLLSDKDQIGYFIASKINEIIQNNAERGIPIKYSDFAILDRSRTPRKFITKWLNYFEIPYNQDENSNLFSDGPINDIYNLCRLCVYPADLNAFAAYLASPFANLTQQSIETILCFENKTDAKLQQLLSENQFAKYENALIHMEEIKKQILSQNLSKTIETLWQKYGYRYETMLNQKTSLYAEQFDMLFELARQTDENGKNPAWFVDQLALIKNTELSAFAEDAEIDVKEITYPLEKDDAVQIMTIHKSKGLQFNYVFVTGCIGVTSKGDKSKLFYDEEYGLSIAPDENTKNYFSIKQKKISQQKELAEFRRIIYVALTRACKEIFIVGAWNGKTSDATDGKVHFNLFENYFAECQQDGNTNAFALDYNEIVPAEKSVLWNIPARKDRANITHNTRISLLSSVYENAQILEPEILENFRSKPSALEKNDEPKASFEEKPLSEIALLDKIISKYIPEDQKNINTSEIGEEKLSSETEDDLIHEYFGYSDYGTLAHQFLEDFVNCGMNDNFSEDNYTGGVKLFKNLAEEDKIEITKCCLAMCKAFNESNLGKQVASAIKENRFVKTEWAFRMFQDGILYTGSLDLIFQNADGTYTLVDYKTDKEKCNEKYIPQQECYKTAAANMLGISSDKIKCKLFYLRYGREENL